MSKSNKGSEANPQAGQGKPLPKKEADLFKSVVKHYEMKQYKKATKQADAILKKFPKHGETLAMKGLTLNCLSQRDEAHRLVKEGLMNDMRSHVCWHVYGLLYRSDRDYNEAIKAYKQALRIDKENLQILRDLSLLQIQMRDLKGFMVTRHQLLSLKPNAKINWLSFALAKHLTGDCRGAINVIDIYIGTLTEGSPELEKGFESSELAMYRNAVLADIPNNYEEALEHLDQCEDVVVDRGAWLMCRAKYQLKLGKYDLALQTFKSIFERGGTENYRVHTGYMCALLELDEKTCKEAYKLRGTSTVATMIPLTVEQKQKLLDSYRGELTAIMPRSQAINRIQLTLLEGGELESAVDAYCRKRLPKGVPSLGSDLFSLLLVERDGRYHLVEDPVDVKSHPTYRMIVDLADGYILSLLKDSKFLSAEENGSSSSDNDTKDKEPPSTILWAWYLRAIMHEFAGEYTEGITLVDKCIDHTPTCVDLYELKARLQKAAGDIKSAVESLDKGRDLDKQDRYINNQTTKYMLQAGMEDTALQRISLFTRHEGNAEQNLFDMQCTWYELELAACLSKKGEHGKSLKKYSAVVKHFDDFLEDQFDFHSYCVRKVTLRAYTDLLRWEDNLWGQEYYVEAAKGIINLYLHLHDNPSITEGEKEPDFSTMTAAQKKKAKAELRKKKKQAEKKAAAEEEKRKAKQAAENTPENGQKNKKQAAQNAVVDPDPDGKELLKKDPLEEAKKFSSILSKYAPDCLITWLLQYDVAIRRGKALMALQGLFKARSLDKNCSEVFTRIVDFASKIENFGKDQAAVREVIASEMPTLLDGQNISDFVSSASAKVTNDPLTDLPTRIAVAKASVSQKTSGVSTAASLIVNGGLDGRAATAANCRDALETLAGFGDEAGDAKAKWVELVKNRFPLLVDFD